MKPSLKGYVPMYSYYILFFMYMGFSTFQGRYLGEELGMSDSQIGLISSLPAVVAMFTQPVWGMLSDRLKFKRTVLIIGTTVAGIAYFFTGFAKGFLPVLLGLIVTSVSLVTVIPTSNSIALEYNRSVMGPLRMTGTIGFQIGALTVGFIFVTGLKGLFQTLGGILILCALLAFFEPPIEGHQHGREKVSYAAVFKNKKISFLLLLVLIACITSQYYNTFFVKMLGDLGFTTSQSGVITFFSILLEIPFLFFSMKIYKKCTMWTWMLIGFGINAVRFTLLGFVDTMAEVLLVNIPTVTVMGCFEFFPALYLNDAVNKELKGSAQSALSLVTAGGAKIIGSIIGGALGDAYGLGTGFMCCGAILAVAFIVFFIPCRKFAKAEPKPAETTNT